MHTSFLEISKTTISFLSLVCKIFRILSSIWIYGTDIYIHIHSQIWPWCQYKVFHPTRRWGLASLANNYDHCCYYTTTIFYVLSALGHKTFAFKIIQKEYSGHLTHWHAHTYQEWVRTPINACMERNASCACTQHMHDWIMYWKYVLFTIIWVWL